MLSQPSKGELCVDSGAVFALREQNKSLLPAGITDVEGDFNRGDIVSIFAPQGKKGEKIGLGITNYSSRDIAAIKGAHSERIIGLLGYEYGAEVVHRDNLVLL